MTGDAAPLAGLLDREPAVVTAGVELFESALRDQATSVTPVAWRPPPPGLAGALARVAADPRTPEANATAVERLVTARAEVVDIRRAGDAVEDLEGRALLHAGPPITWEAASGPLRGAIIGAALYEGWAEDPDAAERLAASGGIALAPCHSRRCVGPMAGIVSPSMPVFVLRDDEHGGEARCTLNEGLGKVLRYGAFGPEVINRLRWMEGVLAPLLRSALERHGPLDVRALVAQALQMGDEGHNRNRAGTSLVLRTLAPHLVEVDAPAADIARVLEFMNANDHFALNLVMPAAKLAGDAARGVPGSTLVVAMARNGTDFGIQVSGTGDRWFTGPAGVPEGLFLGDYGVEDANPDIGDSTITETAGIGGFAMAAAPAIVRFVGGSVPDAVRRTREMYEITLTEHRTYHIPQLEFRGTPTGIDVTRVVRTGVLPSVNTGIAGNVAGVGQVGAGLVDPPLECFTAAVEARAETAADPRAEGPPA